MFKFAVVVFMPWNFNVKQIQKSFTVCFGRDVALGMSFIHSSDHIYCHEEHLLNNLTALYEENLFGLYNNLCSYISYKTLSMLVKSYTDHEFVNKLLVVVDKIDREHKMIDYVKCDPIPAYKRREFIKFHNLCDNLGLNLDSSQNYNWIKNLDDLKFASVLHELGHTYQDSIQQKSEDPWIRMRKMQFKSEIREKWVYKHFELWARDNVPDTTCLSWYLDEIQNMVRVRKDFD